MLPPMHALWSPLGSSKKDDWYDWSDQSKFKSIQLFKARVSFQKKSPTWSSFVFMKDFVTSQADKKFLIVFRSGIDVHEVTIHWKKQGVFAMK